MRRKENQINFTVEPNVPEIMFYLVIHMMNVTNRILKDME